MCRNIKPLFNYEPPATDEEIYASSLQYVRKVSGFAQPSKANRDAFETAVREISNITKELLDTLETAALPRNRTMEVARARTKAEERFGRG